MPDSIDKVGEGFEFCDGGEGVEISPENVAELTDSLVGGYFEDYEKAKTERGREVKGWLDHDSEALARMSKDPDSVVARDENGKITGIGGIEKLLCPEYKGRPVIMFTRLTVLPDTRGRGVFTEIISRLEAKAKAKWRNGIFVVMTRNPIVKKGFSSRGFVSIGLVKYHCLVSEPQCDKGLLERIREIEAEGWDVLCSGTSVDEIVGY